MNAKGLQHGHRSYTKRHAQASSRTMHTARYKRNDCLCLQIAKLLNAKDT